MACCLTAAEDQPPYSVCIHDGPELLSKRTFDRYDDAHAYALEELQRLPAEPAG